MIRGLGSVGVRFQAAAHNHLHFGCCCCGVGVLCADRVECKLTVFSKLQTDQMRAPPSSKLLPRQQLMFWEENFSQTLRITQTTFTVHLQTRKALHCISSWSKNLSVTWSLLPACPVCFCFIPVAPAFSCLFSIHEADV